ncbi:hypothetical protein [Sinanaerobacter chloroacetimidivorans]|jgi:hypothetical protein|uniref:SCP2 domain-containing protein n=1 Tax=Sinanaerobacter chloroacetimidivorans TaxID=2818044 RepID=A0A8J7W3Y6_9FIRM|nr:hypothetical protein [Sinanaerobacter chloroacetimidivorans]MBR0600482.1 hypothetical protein [Sinanaerobacter chloroacetimidivorans]
MSAKPQDIMTAKLFFNAAFPVMQVLLDDDPKMKEKFKDVIGTVQFGAKNDGELLACHLVFNCGKVTVMQGPAENPDITMTFPTIAKMNALLRGGTAIPAIRGLKNFSLLTKVLSLLMGLMIMSPGKRPKDFAGQSLKVKMSLYMITRALSQYNKLGDPSMQEFCQRQPDRIYQFTVEHGDDKDYIACYLRIKAGKSKSGHGVYTRRSPFVHFRFLSVEGAMAVLLKDVEFVEGVGKGYVETVGSPEYACYLNDYMAILQGMLT